MTDLVERIERNRFVGREFLLWLWFESMLFETNLAPTGEPACALWLEARLTLAFEKDESVLKTAAPGAAPEAKEALRQGKLPREARLRLVSGEREYAWLFKGDTLGLANLSIPAELTKKDDEVHEVLYERMRLVEALEATLDALFSDFLALRLGAVWEEAIVPALVRFAHDEAVDEASYRKAKQRALGKRSRG
ncbi:hypothetical protein [Sorangium sp. So ce1389]|uniref:hypothetical protein n=1 Tax=Sorangium sp. So ce1389 TaxID=3133336 RepID=UPI003F6476D2